MLFLLKENKDNITIAKIEPFEIAGELLKKTETIKHNIK